MTALFASEMLKLRSTRTPWVLLAATVALSGLAVASAVAVAGVTDLDLESVSGGRAILGVSATGAIFVLVFGIILTAGEFRHGTAIDTFLTTPRRSMVTLAKVGTAAATGVVFGLLASAASLGSALVAYQARGLTFPFGSSDAWQALGAGVIYATLFAAMGAATGSLVRNQVVAIAGWLSWIAIVEHVAQGLLPSVGRWLPVGAGRGLMAGAGAEDLLDPLPAAIVLAGYALTIMVVAVVAERHRDA
jgi:ABC-2 type transport system permease protein